MTPPLYEDEHEAFRDVVREFVRREVTDNLARWDADRLIDRDVWRAAGKQGLLGLAVDEAHGGGGTRDYRYRCVVNDELTAVGATALNLSFALQDDIVLPYLLEHADAEQRLRWLPGMCQGELIGAIAMSEPGAGSDLRGITTTARRDGEDWVLSGAKTFISNGINADLVVTAARTSDAQDRPSVGLFVVERDMPGFTRGRKLDKIGMVAQDTAELFFDDVRVPAANVLGDPHHGLRYLMTHLPLERLSIAVGAIGAARSALDWTVGYVQQRRAFGIPLADQQTIRFTLAELTTELEVTGGYVDDAVRAYNAGDLTAVDAAKVKWWTTEFQKRLVDRCLQLFGGYGYMAEYPIARAYVDARVQTIYGGTTEIMKTIIGRDIVGRR
ncbi:acyl-CoA dehydrogenase family protein [Nakamurella endophytica]|uniref:acyl-CoA dehydrogenase family protein n=1 Tax=Nakamurella endophytica TaxID=1748367 RepID=UPI0016687903